MYKYGILNDVLDLYVEEQLIYILPIWAYFNQIQEWFDNFVFVYNNQYHIHVLHNDYIQRFKLNIWSVQLIQILLTFLSIKFHFLTHLKFKIPNY